MWVHYKTLNEGEDFLINGLNIWDFEWDYINDFCDCFSPCKCGVRVIVKDPNYNAPYNLDIVRIKTDGQRITFGITEFYNTIFGIYLEE